MREGRGEEFDHPYSLLVNQIGDENLTKTDGYFAKMVQSTGEETANSLFEIAK